MTKSEMTELFAAIMLLYPHDKLFSRGIEALKPTIELWTKVVNIDFQTAQRALILAFRKCKFPPTPADILEAAADLQSYLVSKVDEAVSSIKSGCFLHGSLEAYYGSLGKGSPIRAAIDAVGGHRPFTFLLAAARYGPLRHLRLHTEQYFCVSSQAVFQAKTPLLYPSKQPLPTVKPFIAKPKDTTI